jgi:hypothetical protein
MPLAEVMLPFLAPFVKYSAVTAVPVPVGPVIPATVVVVRITIVIGISRWNGLRGNGHVDSRVI